MQFCTSSLLVVSSLLLSAFVSAEDLSAGLRQVTVPGAKAIKKRTDEPQKEEARKPSPPPVRAASNFGGAGNNTGKKSIFDFDDDFDMDWARRRGVKVDPQAAAKRPAAAAPAGGAAAADPAATKPAAAADPFANLRKATEELSKKINMDELLKNDSLKEIVQPLTDAAATGNKEDALKSIRQKSEELLKDPNSLRQLTENLMKDPGMKKLVDQFNPAAMKDGPLGDLFGGKPGTGAGTGFDDLLKSFGAGAPLKTGAGANTGAGNGWDDLFKNFGAGAPQKTGPNAGKANSPFAGLDDLFGDLFAPKGKAGQVANSDDSFDKRYKGDFASLFDSDVSEQEL